jgi:hypothetical protein
MTKYQNYKLLIITCFSVLFLLIFYCYSSNGRYLVAEGVIVDTKTGKIYIPSSKVYMDINEYTPIEKTE